MSRRNGDPALPFIILEHTRIAGFYVHGWARTRLFRKERCACQSYACPYTRGIGVHVTPWQP